MPETVNCPRCGRVCQVGPEGSPNARLLRRSGTAKGLCANCAATEFIQGIPSVMVGIEKNGVALVLSNPHVQAGFADVMTVGNADARPGEIVWADVIKHWDLPFPGRRRRRDKSRDNAGKAANDHLLL